MLRQCRQWWARVVAAWPFVTKYRMLREISVAKDREADRVTAQWRASAWEVERQKAESTFRKLIAIERESSNETDAVHLRLKFSPRLFYSRDPDDRAIVAREVAYHVEHRINSTVVLRPGVRL